MTMVMRDSHEGQSEHAHLPCNKGQQSCATFGRGSWSINIYQMFIQDCMTAYRILKMQLNNQEVNKYIGEKVYRRHAPTVLLGCLW